MAASFQESRPERLSYADFSAPAEPFKTAFKGGHGIASGYNPGGMVLGGGPATGLSGAPPAAMTRFAALPMGLMALPLGMMKLDMTTRFRLLEAVVLAARSNPVRQ
ncbi:hypothetical protein ACFQS7_28735 [Dankookia sp. GCM10030260]|uniref:hypothetical protein n=1 Tax=Dankookia sp. GCM10030260 TaxID=3273390 RepID=UPI0036169E07